MYIPDLNSKDRSSAVAAAIALQAALLIAFLNMAGTIERHDNQSPLKLVNVPLELPPPLAHVRQNKQRPKRAGSSPKGLAREATALVVPTPAIILPPMRRISATSTPHNGLAPTQGLANAGSGTGAGGTGSGTGEGSGSGAGDGGAAVEPPRLATPVLTGYDFSRDMLEQWPRAATVFLRLKVDARGFVAECMLDRGTNIAFIDSQMCNTAHDRLRFRPAMNRYGQAVAGWFGYAQPAPR